jgi:hypothetical protein
VANVFTIKLEYIDALVSSQTTPFDFLCFTRRLFRSFVCRKLKMELRKLMWKNWPNA